MNESFTQLADSLASDYASIKKAQASAPITAVDSSNVTKPVVLSTTGGVSWKSPYVMGAGVLAAALIVVGVVLRRRK